MKKLNKIQYFTLALLILALICIIWSASVTKQEPPKQQIVVKQEPALIKCLICERWVPRTHATSVGRSGRLILCDDCFDKVFIWLFTQYMRSQLKDQTTKRFE